MEIDIKDLIPDSVKKFRLPRYAELPDVGLYLEQVTKYINGFLAPVCCAEITASMISNYVKKGFIEPPQKKQYGAGHIAYLMFIAIVKNVLSLENICKLFEIQKQTYSVPKSYDYFCDHLEKSVRNVFGIDEEETEESKEKEKETGDKQFLRNIIISVSHSLLLGVCFSALKKEENKLS